MARDYRLCLFDCKNAVYAKQDLRPEDQDVKFNYQVKIILLVKAGKITEGYQYLLGMFHAMQSLSANLNFEQLVDYVVKLPRIEQWLIKTEFDHHLTHRESKHDANRLVWVLINNLPLIQKISTGNFEDPTTYNLIPSSLLINYVLQTLNQQPLRMRPVADDPKRIKFFFSLFAYNTAKTTCIA